MLSYTVDIIKDKHDKVINFSFNHSPNTVNSPYCGHPRDRELVSLIQREFVIAGIYFSQSSVLYFCRVFSCCPYNQGVRNSEVSARRELTVFILNLFSLE